MPGEEPSWWTQATLLGPWDQEQVPPLGERKGGALKATREGLCPGGDPGHPSGWP